MDIHSHPVLRQQPAVEKKPNPPSPGPSPWSVAGTDQLEEIFRANEDSEKSFRHKAVLLIGAECYDAPTITILQGLDQLGFSVYTLRKPNINSWFCNRVIESPTGLEFDFILSNIQWGVQWNLFDRYRLHDRLKVLIDGGDNHGDMTWREKLERRVRPRCRPKPPEEVVLSGLQPHQWMDPLGSYEPDVLFASQKFPGYEAAYLPFGIHRECLALREGKATNQRSVDFAHVSGDGSARGRLADWLRASPPPGMVHNGPARGEAVVSDEIAPLVEEDNGPAGDHSYFRWVLYRGYFSLLNDAKVLVYPNVWIGKNWWDSKRPWEAYASGCLVMLERPSVDMNEYPATGLCPFATYDSKEELLDKCHYLHGHQDELESMRSKSAEAALRYFTPVPLARRFLAKIAVAR